MVLPFEHVSEPDATGDSGSEIDSHLHLDIGLEPRLSREVPSDSISFSSIKMSSA
jgi:hypothetical protein